MLRFLIATSRWVVRLIKWLFLLTLPLTIIPIFSGSFNGIVWGYWNMRHIDKNTNKFLDETKDILSDWGVGGNVPTFREYLDTHNDFHLMRINANDWASKLGFGLPTEYADLEDPNIGIDKLADLGTLMRDTSCRSEAQKPREQWLYLSFSSYPAIDKWDAVFNEVLEYVHAHTTLNQSGFYHAMCGDTAGFLCGVWSTRPPALLHFKVEDFPPDPEDIEEGLTYRSPLEYLRPVTVRLIEFPLKDEFTGLPYSVFPSFKQQMLSMVAGDRLYEQFEPFDIWDQTNKRFKEHMDKLWDAPGTVLSYINKADDWMIDHVTKPLGIEPYLNYLDNIFFTLFAITSDFTCAIYQGASYVIGDFLGLERPGDRSLAGIDLDQSPEERFWGDVGYGMGVVAADKGRRAAEQRSTEGHSDTSMTITTA